MDGKITIGTELDTKEFDVQIANLEKQLEQMEQDYKRALQAGAKVEDAPMRKLAEETEKARNKLVGLYQQKMKLEKSGGFDKMTSSLNKAIKKASTLALGIFGIRSAYLAVRRASSDLANYDKQYATNLEYIRYVLTQAIAPVLRWIVDLTATILRYVRMIIEALFGINIFSNGSADSFAKMKKNAGGVSKAVKDIKKQLAGFDEMNVLSDQNTGSGGGAGGFIAPSFDLGGGEVPGWIQWITDNKNSILAVLAGIAGAILAIKLGLGGIKALGIGLMIGGITYAIQGLLDYLENPTWASFGQVIQGIGLAIIGLGVAFLGLPAVIAGVVTLIFGIIVAHWNEIKAFLQGGIDWLRGQMDWVKENFGLVGEFIFGFFIDLLQNMLDAVDQMINGIRQMFDGFIDFFAGIFTGDWDRVVKGLGEIFNGLIQTITGAWKIMWNVLITAVQKAWDFITGIFSKLGQWFGNLIGTIVGKFRDFGAKVGEVVSGAFKGVVNGILGAIERILNTPIRAINGLIDIINAIPGVNLGRLATFNLRRLAVGGIVNMPNRGTMIGGAIAGESGREGVIPLTDTQAMAELGEAIGRYITINASIVNTMNGRIISRELKQIQNEQNFAYNM